MIIQILNYIKIQQQFIWFSIHGIVIIYSLGSMKSLVLIGIILPFMIIPIYSGTSTSNYAAEKCSNTDTNQLTLTSDELFSYKDNLNYLYNDYFKIQSTSTIKYQVHALAKQSLKNRKVTLPSKQSPDGFNNVPGVIFNYLPFMVGILITILSIPIILIFWCARWEKFFSCYNDEKKFKTCERYWPRVLMGILLIILFTFSIVGAVFSGLFVKTTKNTQCLAAQSSDTMINGAKDSSGAFAGLSSIYTLSKNSPNSILMFNSLISSFDTQTKKLNSPLSALRTQVKNIPDGSGGSVQLTYSTPIHQSASTGQITSTFVDRLGNQNVQNSLIGNNTLAIDTTNSYLAAISTFYGNVASVSSNAIAQMDTQLGNALQLLTGFQDLSKNMQQKNANLTPIKIFGIVCIVYFAIVSVLVVLTVVTCLLKIFNKNKKVKYLLYISWTFVAVFAIIGYIISIIFGYAYPYQIAGCKFGDSSLDNKENFKKSYDGIFTPLQLEFIGECLPNEKGFIFPIILGSNNVQYLLTNLTGLSKSINGYINFAPSRVIDATFKTIGMNINYYLNSQAVDIDDAITYSKLQDLSNHAKYSCSDTGFKADSWIPSTQQLIIPCQVPGLNSTSQTCPQQSSFTARSSGCTGCMDSNSFAVQNSAKAQSDIQTLILNRYNNVANCNTFSTELSNVWVNYYIKKNTVLSPVLTRYNNAQSQQKSTISALQTFQAILIPFQQALNTLDPYFNAQTGIVASLDCRVYGRKLVNMMNYACKNYIYTSRMILVSSGIISLSLSILLCLLPCIRRRNIYEETTQQVKTSSEMGSVPYLNNAQGGANQSQSANGLNASNTFNSIQH